MKIIRRKYIVDARLQIRYTLFFVLISLIGNIIAVASFNALALKQLDALMWSTHISIHSTDELIRTAFIFVNVINFLFVAVLLVFTGYMMLKKTSGPLTRMSKDISKVAAGDLSARITLRQNDEFKEVADELNGMLVNLTEKFSGIKERYKAIPGPILIHGNVSGDKEEPIRNYNALLKSIEDLEAEVNKLKP